MDTDRPNLLKLLSLTQFAEGLTNSQLQCLCRASRLLRLPADSVLFREGTIEDEVFVVSSGHVRLCMNVPGRGAVCFLTAGPGDLVGWSGLIGNGQMTATATTTDDSVLIALSGKGVRALCSDDHELGQVLMQRIAQVLSQRLLSTRLQLLDLYSQAAAGS